jgi:hypothetical protein
MTRRKEVSDDGEQGNYSAAIIMKRRLWSRGNIERKSRLMEPTASSLCSCTPVVTLSQVSSVTTHRRAKVVGQLCGHENRRLLAFDGRMLVVGAGL